MQRRVFDGRGNGLHLRQRLGARLRLLGGRSAGRVASDIVLQLFALRLLLRASGLLLSQPFGTLALKRVIAARIESDLPPFQMQDVIDDIVEQVALVADDDDRAAIGLEEILQPERRFEIEVV
jgi:hypothetical protein